MAIQASGPGSQYANNTLKNLPTNASSNLGNGGYYIPPVNNQPSVYKAPGPTQSVLGDSTSSGGNVSRVDQLRQIQGQGGLNPAQQTELDQLISGQGDINGAINDTYNASNGYLNQAESQLRSDYPTIQQDINGQFDTSKGALDTTHTSSVNQLGQYGQQADYAHETALAAARRLYSELRQGYQQRFGGATSAGEAAGELANVEQQRQEGQQNRSYQDTIQTINNKKLDVENQYQTGLQALVQQKNESLNQANRDFQNKLLQISQSRAANEAAKGQARLSALQDLRNQIFQINQQNVQFQQTLEAQRQAAHLQLQNYAQSAGQGVGDAGTAYGGYQQTATTAPTSTLNPGAGMNTQTQGPQYTGAISRNPNDQYTGAVTPDYLKQNQFLS